MMLQNRISPVIVEEVLKQVPTLLPIEFERVRVYGPKQESAMDVVREYGCTLKVMEVQFDSIPPLVILDTKVKSKHLHNARLHVRLPASWELFGFQITPVTVKRHEPVHESIIKGNGQIFVLAAAEDDVNYFFNKASWDRVKSSIGDLTALVTRLSTKPPYSANGIIDTYWFKLEEFGLHEIPIPAETIRSWEK